MAATQTFSEELISKLTCTRESRLGGMIRNIPPAQFSAIDRDSTRSSLGLLDTLPMELLWLTLNLLDFQSLSRISRVSLKGKTVVEALPAYQDVMEHAPMALTALGKTRLLRCHSAMLLRQALRSDKCASCFDFGAFLFLPTCERVCFECLHENHAFWVTTPALAKRCFGLTERELKKIPIMYSIPGIYGVRLEVAHRRVCRLVSVKQAKKLAIEVHGSVDELKKFKPTSCSGKMTMKEFYIFKKFHDAPMEPPGCDMSRLPEKKHGVEDRHGGMACIRYPYLTETGADHGRLCEGCQLTYREYDDGSLPARVLAGLTTREAGPHRPLNAIIARLRSKDGLKTHISLCYGARRLLAEWGED